MKNWYCIIQGRDDDNFYWKQIIKDIIQAETKKEARLIVESDYLTSLPMRIKQSDLNHGSFLLSLYEIPEYGQYSFLNEMFKITECKYCGLEYRPVDMFNIKGSSYAEYCSYDCKDKDRENNFKYENFNVAIPVIYKITQVSTGKIYIGKTIRSFTLRWWEHIKSKEDDKFHTAVKESPIEDFIFQVIETVDTEKHDILERENYWIDFYNSTEKGFNTISGNNKQSDSNKQTFLQLAISK